MHIVYYPDPVLLQRAGPVDPAWEDLAEFAAGMLATMEEAQGVGLAAPQVGRSLRLFVASETGKAEDGDVFVNPELEPFGPIVTMEEGCLSLPGIHAEIARPEFVRARWLDAAGERREGEFEGYLARILQHEFDHLNGVLFFERMAETDRLRVRDDLLGLADQYRGA